MVDVEFVSEVNSWDYSHRFGVQLQRLQCGIGISDKNSDMMPRIIYGRLGAHRHRGKGVSL